MNGEIDGLLEKLKEMDPETFGYFVAAVKRVDMKDKRVLWALQGVIQDAIAARGWGLTVEYPAHQWGAEIRFSHTGRIRNADTPAEAILAAYIQALEAEASK